MVFALLITAASLFIGEAIFGNKHDNSCTCQCEFQRDNSGFGAACCIAMGILLFLAAFVWL